MNPPASDGPLRVINTSRGSVLAERAELAASARQRMRGLLGRDGLEPGGGLYISPCTSIHSFGMRFVFDAVFVDRGGRVLHLISRMKKWRLSRIVPRAAGVLELPAGTLERSATEKGDRLAFAPAAPPNGQGSMTSKPA